MSETTDAEFIQQMRERDFPPHRYLAFDRRPDKDAVHEVSRALMNFYFKKSLSRTEWRKQKPARVRWRRGYAREYTEYQSEPMALKDLDTALVDGVFQPKYFGLFEPKCDWLDGGLLGTSKAYAPRRMALAIAGSTLPLVPQLDREGVARTSFQFSLQNRIVDLRRQLVDLSHDFESDHWFELLRYFVSDCVSLIDTTLHQLYYHAEHARPMGWTFDPDRLGQRHGRRLVDKLKWVSAITGKEFNAQDEVRAFERLKDVRNHLQHFDPPCFCCSLDDAAGWLNAAVEVGRLAWKIRNAIDAPLTKELIDIILAPRIRVVPKEAGDRPPQPLDAGYASCVQEVDRTQYMQIAIQREWIPEEDPPGEGAK